VALREGGVPVFREIDSAIRSLARAAARPSPTDVPALPEPARPEPELGYLESRQLLAGAGIPFPVALKAENGREAAAAAGELGYPVVLKALGVVHKSDAGGVVLGIEDEEALLAAVESVGAATYSVERQVDDSGGIELIVGCRRDPRFGPILLVGLGGVFAEVLNDVAAALAPATPELVERLLLGLRGAPLLTGARGRPPLDVGGAAEACAALSQVAAEHPELDELEINPLLLTPDFAIGLDARAVHSQPR
jgi:acyl-CoA synthetase (NDP forming)